MFFLMVPDTIYYISNFITRDEEIEIISKVNNAPKPKWTQLSNRRLQNWGGVPHPNGMIAEAVPQWLRNYMDKIEMTGLFSDKTKLNHVLVNEYTPGQGIMPHLDGPLFYPTVTTISCGSDTVLNFYCSRDSSSHIHSENNKFENGDHKLNKQYSLLLERRSLLILQDDMYKKYLHGIDEVDSDVVTDSIANLKQIDGQYAIGQKLIRDIRISLTIRHVPKTSKLKLNFLR
ncbi:putative RNA/DNA demethylase ALKBH6 isoform X2 [Lycorma delicatula]|uniref:putative RNA/DNA demethylase ALKBH6 isoform X2 n=1 Tax=Lycorma delicatula TaxID=130591 RepID=UPI003F514555